MNKIFVGFILIVSFFCESCHKKSYMELSSLQRNDSLYLNLTKYRLGALKKYVKGERFEYIKTLKVIVVNGWTSYTIIDQKIYAPSIKNESMKNTNYILGVLEKLKRIEKLDISSLELYELPKSISSLKSLEKLDVSFNKMDFVKEIVKIRDLNNLKVLKVYGLNLDSVLLDSLSMHNPGLVLKHTVEQFKNE